MYEEGEAKAVVRLLLEDGFRLSFADIACGKLASLGKAETERLEDYMGRLRLGEPVQYVLGEAGFAGRMFLVSRDVLIPRPETAELCRLLTDRYNLPYCALQPPEPLRVLDVGTGSGCIAVTPRPLEQRGVGLGHLGRRAAGGPRERKAVQRPGQSGAARRAPTQSRRSTGCRLRHHRFQSTLHPPAGAQGHGTACAGLRTPSGTFRPR